MGSCLSKVAPAPIAHPDKPLEEWDSAEVEYWFSGLPRVHRWRELLLPEDGCVVANTWSVEFLMQKGLPKTEAIRLVAYRDRAAAKAAAATTTAGAAAPSAGAAAVGVPVQAEEPAPATATLTVTRVVVKQRAAPDASGPGSAATAAAPSSQQETFVALAKKGLKLVRVAVERLGPSLPFPGAEAANLVLILLDAVDAAVANAGNLDELCKRALAFLDILSAYQAELVALRRYKEVVCAFRDHLTGIVSYARTYASRNCLMRLLTSGGDAETYEALAAGMRDLGDRVAVLLAADGNARLQALQGAVEESRALLATVAQHQDPSAEARDLVKELGGLEAVMADAGKLRSVVQKLDVSAQVTIETVSLLLQSHLDKGPQRHILQPDLRLFWAKRFGGEAEVPWFAFWRSFPALLKETLPEAAIVDPLPADAAMVEELGRLLADDAKRQTLQRALERANPDTLSVWELHVAFAADEALLVQVARLLGGAAASSLAVMDAAPAAAPTGGAAQGSSSLLPQLPPHYTGRDEEAASIAAHLQSHGSLVLLAPGGFGKSCLAADVGARLLRAGAAAAVWVDLREAGGSGAAEVEARFCAALGLQMEKADNAPRIVAAARRLVDKGGSGAGPSAAAAIALVVVDNAEDALLQSEGAAALRGLLGKVVAEAPAVRLLLTTRDALGGGLPLAERHVGAIRPDAAARLVLASASDLTQQQAEEVAAACRCVPLTLGLVAEALTSGRLALEDLPKLTAAGGAGDADATSATVRLVLASLSRTQQLAAARLAVLPSWFDEDAAAAVTGLPGSQPHATLAMLHKHGVLQRAGGRRYIMHMLVRQQAAQLGAQLDRTLRPRAEGCFVRFMLRLLREWGGMYTSGKESRLALVAAREQQADLGRLRELMEGLSPEHGVEAAAVAEELTSNVVELLDALGMLSQMVHPCQALLAALETTSEEVTEARASLLYLLGVAHVRGGRYQEAEDAASRSYDLRGQALGPEHPETVSSCNSLALCIQARGRYEEAEPLYRQALELSQRILGPEHLNTITSINNLALCIQARGRYEEAEPLYRQALELQQQILGPEHPGTITSINNLAACIRARGRCEEAEPLFRQALELRQRILGSEHPGTITSINNFACCIDARGRYDKAEPLYRQALELSQPILGPEHPDTITSISNVALCIQARGHYEEAEPLYRQALELYQRILGPEHPSTIASTTNLASCIQARGRCEEAEPLYRQALELSQRILGPEHPDTITSINNLAACIQARGRCEEAEPLYRQALELYQRILGPEHPDTITSISNVALCIQERGHYEEAEPLYRQALELRQRILGPEHPDLAITADYLGDCLLALGRADEAEAVYRQAVRIALKALGQEHYLRQVYMGDLRKCVESRGGVFDEDAVVAELSG